MGWFLGGSWKCVQEERACPVGMMNDPFGFDRDRKRSDQPAYYGGDDRPAYYHGANISMIFFHGTLLIYGQ